MTSILGNYTKTTIDNGGFIGSTFVSSAEAKIISEYGGFVGNVYITPLEIRKIVRNGGYIGNTFIESKVAKSIGFY